MKNFMLSELAPLKEENMNRPGIIFHIENSGTNADGVYGLFWGQSIQQKIQINNEEQFITICYNFSFILIVGSGFSFM